MEAAVAPGWNPCGEYQKGMAVWSNQQPLGTPRPAVQCYPGPSSLLKTSCSNDLDQYFPAATVHSDVWLVLDCENRGVLKMKKSSGAGGLAVARVFVAACLAVVTTVGAARAATVTYSLVEVFLVDGGQITGSFDWTYTIDDFEGGVGNFSALEIPYTNASLDNAGLNITIETGSIEITSIGNYHDEGLDITLRLPLLLDPTQSTPIAVGPDPGSSYFECCGNGFKDQPFRSGSIAPIISPIAKPSAWWRFAIPPYVDR